MLLVFDRLARSGGREDREICLTRKGSVDSLNLPAFQARADQFSAASVRANDLIARSRIALASLSRSISFSNASSMLVAAVRTFGMGRRG